MGYKRRRIALSCVDCRRRKVKCDRTYPACVRCQKGGYADSCVYVPYEGAGSHNGPGSHNGGPTTSDARAEREQSQSSWTEELGDYATLSGASRAPRIDQHRVATPRKSTEKSETVKRLEQKVIALEARVEAAYGREAARTNLFAQQVLGIGIPTPGSTTAHDNATTSSAGVELEQILLRGKSFKTQYYGPSNYGSILIQFSELSDFLKDIMNRMPSICRYKSKTDGPHKRQRPIEAAVQKEASHGHAVLLNLVPEREIADGLVEHYLDNFEYTYRILHVPSFLREYEQFWQMPQQSTTGFLVVLLLVMACVYSIYPREPASFVGRSSRRREMTIRWVAACDSWMQAQSHKHVTITTNQVQILLFLAKRINCIKVKRAWTNGGHLLRLAMASGLHREPTLLSSKISIFHQEMRRRLWATVLELELLTAIDRGMPGSICALDWDCQPPSNMHDEDFNEHSQQLPPSKPYHEFTRTSFLCTALQSTPLRLDILSTINRVKSTLTLEIASQYDVKIRQAYANVPSWSFDLNSRLPRTIARLNLLEFINLIHQPFVTSVEDPAKHFFSRAATRDAAATILELYRDIVETDRLILPFCRNDGFRAALCLCYDLSSNSVAGSTTMLDRNRATELIEHVLKMQKRRVMQLGQGFHSFWITSSALSLAYSKLAPQEDPGKYAQQAADRVLKMNDRIVALQEPIPDGETPAPIGDELLGEARRVLTKRNVLPGRGGATDVAEPGLEPFANTQLDFDTFNLAEIWDLASYDDFGWV